MSLCYLFFNLHRDIFCAEIVKYQVKIKKLLSNFKIPTMNRFKHFIEWQVFGVCSYLGDKIGIASSTIRKYFIYISLVTMGSPIIFYIFVAFWMNVKNYILSAKRNPLRNL